MSGITAIVCTYNRAQDLERCTAALQAQTLSPANLQIIIVDNNSTDYTESFSRSLCEKDCRFNYVSATKQGLAHARNAGMLAAKFELCAFTDDDAVVRRDWATRLLERFVSLPNDTAAIGGEIDPVFSIAPPDWLTDDMLRALSAKLGWSKDPRFCRPDEWLCEANTAYRKSYIMEAGGFPENLGRIGTNLLSGENAVNFVLAERGLRFFYDPNIRVDHSIPANRLTKEWFRRRYFWQGITTYYVNQYLSERGIHKPMWSPISVPCTERAWMSTFNNDESEFNNALDSLTNLGYLLASQNCIGGR